LDKLPYVVFDFVCCVILYIFPFIILFVVHGQNIIQIFDDVLNNIKLEMWAIAQRDGRPAEYRRHPQFNAAKFG